MTVPLLARERRAQKLLHWFADGSPRCTMCGEADPDALVIVVHHVGGRLFGGMPVLVCGNCHKRLTIHQAPYVHLLGLPDCPWWVRRLVWELDMAVLLERQAWESLRRAHDDAERHGLTEAGAPINDDAVILQEVALRCRDRARGLLERYSSTPEGRALLERAKPHRRSRS